MRPVPYPGRGPFSARTGCLTAVILLFLCRADSALALDMEFYTYNGFGPVTQAFRKLALIFSDGGFVGLFFTATVLGILFAAMAFTVRMATGARIVPLVWAMPVLLGVVLYLGLFVPKGNITVYDPVLNRFDTIGGIPNGVVATAGILNKIERGLVEIIDTAGVPGARYQEAAGGIGFSTLKAAMNAGPKDAFARESMARYFQDC
ncbi:MAG: conjugal transfer protein TraG N-terminal domain-containing protein, partial [Thermodesulfobacteriota bacterium]